jgi:type III secretion protein L
MVIWLHGTQVPTGLTNGVLRAAEVESLRSLEDVRQELMQQQSDILNAAHSQAEELLTQAQAQAQEMLDDAQAQAQAMLDEMDAQVKQAKREGYEAGRKRNATEWAERQTLQTQSRAQALQNMHEKLAVIVTSAVERIVHTEQRDALYQRALRSVQTLTRGASQLTLRVGPADYEAAAKAVGDLKGLAANGVQLEVAVDPALKNGSCIFESELGILDASLETQLAGLRNAMDRAVHRALASAEEDPETALGDELSHELGEEALGETEQGEGALGEETEQELTADGEWDGEEQEGVEALAQEGEEEGEGFEGEYEDEEAEYLEGEEEGDEGEEEGDEEGEGEEREAQEGEEDDDDFEYDDEDLGDFEDDEDEDDEDDA